MNFDLRSFNSRTKKLRADLCSVDFNREIQDLILGSNKNVTHVGTYGSITSSEGEWIKIETSEINVIN